MPNYFFDTSVLTKLYHEEAGTDFIERLAGQRGSVVVISRLSLVEIESVLAIKMRTGELDAAGQELCRRRLRADISQGRIRVAPAIEERHYRSARRLLGHYGVAMALRTLDALQLAVALELLQAGQVSVFVAADKKLCRVAEACGCATINSSEPGKFVL